MIKILGALCAKGVIKQFQYSAPSSYSDKVQSAFLPSYRHQHNLLENQDYLKLLS